MKLYAILIVSALLFTGANGQLARVDSVTVDSIWVSDSAGNVQRDVLLSFVPIATDSVTCVVDLSGDSGKTWNCNRNFFDGIGSTASFRAAPNKKRSVVLRFFRGDTTNFKLRVTARSDTVSLGRFRIAIPVDSWLESPSSYYYYRDWRGMAQLIDGGFMPYYQNGMVDGFRDTLIKQDTLHAGQFIMDCGTRERADRVFAAKISSYRNLAVLPGFPDSSALAYLPLSGASVYGHFGHFFFESWISGADQPYLISQADTLMNYYKRKTGM